MALQTYQRTAEEPSWGECVMEMSLCDEQGWVGGHPAGPGAGGYRCTGGFHTGFGTFIRCTSNYHSIGRS